MRRLVWVAALLGVAASAHAGPAISNPRGLAGGPEAPDSVRVQRFEYGFLLGTPAIFNLELGYWPDRIAGVRAAGMYYGHGRAGVQGSLCLTVARSARSRLAVALVGGTLRERSEDFTYGGVALDWNASLFFLELGIVKGTGEIDFFSRWEVTPIVQIGIIGGGGVSGPR